MLLNLAMLTMLALTATLVRLTILANVDIADNADSVVRARHFAIAVNVIDVSDMSSYQRSGHERVNFARLNITERTLGPAGSVHAMVNSYNEIFYFIGLMDMLSAILLNFVPNTVRVVVTIYTQTAIRAK